jgi:DNA adenine methylase
MEQTAEQERLAYFIDPPYTAGRKGKRAGTRLYTHFELDHERLFRVCEGIGDFLMTYDNDPYVHQLAHAHGFDLEPISMTGTHCSERNELLIGPNLDWARC